MRYLFYEEFPDPSLLHRSGIITPIYGVHIMSHLAQGALSRLQVCSCTFTPP